MTTAEISFAQISFSTWLLPEEIDLAKIYGPSQTTFLGESLSSVDLPKRFLARYLAGPVFKSTLYSSHTPMPGSSLPRPPTHAISCSTPSCKCTMVTSPTRSPSPSASTEVRRSPAFRTAYGTPPSISLKEIPNTLSLQTKASSTSSSVAPSRTDGTSATFSQAPSRSWIYGGSGVPRTKGSLAPSIRPADSFTRGGAPSMCDPWELRCCCRGTR
ncbi:hypothetical protein BC937DRAFT_92622 [Endogone sp. FLAS-F59071]|nr:hypothetical protein BC937DRAFT_92622 [Endogone sp. FLAS-F59071]|eukprot:RUS21466.1 hypothetical protein BC937DRAFT_92622 [Endogone sp. FLAS-F59071]